MTTINITGKTEKAHIPSDWSELTGAQIKFLYEQYFYLLRHQQINLFYDRLLCHFVPKKLQRGEFTKKFQGKTVKHNNSAEIAHLLFDWILTYDGEKLNFTFNETINHLPEIQVNNVKFKGPADLLTNISFKEFTTALEFQNEFAEGDKEIMPMFIASIYHRVEKGKRKDFDENQIENDAKILKKLPEWQQTMIIHWFANCMNYIQTRDLKVNGNVLSFAPLFAAGKTKKTQSLGWDGICMSIAEKQIFGDVEKTAKAKLFDILLFLLKTHFENEEMKKEYEKINKSHKK